MPEHRRHFSRRTARSPLGDPWMLSHVGRVREVRFVRRTRPSRTPVEVSTNATRIANTPRNQAFTPSLEAPITTTTMHGPASTNFHQPPVEMVPPMRLHVLYGNRDRQIGGCPGADPPCRLVGALVANQLHHVGAVFIAEPAWIQPDEHAVQTNGHPFAVHTVAPPAR